MLMLIIWTADIVIDLNYTLQSPLSTKEYPEVDDVPYTIIFETGNESRWIPLEPFSQF